MPEDCSDPVAAAFSSARAGYGRSNRSADEEGDAWEREKSFPKERLLWVSCKEAAWWHGT